MNVITVNAREMCVMKQHSLVSTGDINPEIAYIGEKRLRRKGRV